MGNAISAYTGAPRMSATQSVTHERRIARDSLSDHPDSWARSVASALIHDVIPFATAGFTFDPRTLCFANFGPDTYVVSLRGHERRFGAQPTQRELVQWLSPRWSLLRRPGAYVGGWRNPRDGLFYFDVSRAVETYRLAHQLGLMHGQQAIYHPATSSNIALPGGHY